MRETRDELRRGTASGMYEQLIWLLSIGDLIIQRGGTVVELVGRGEHNLMVRKTAPTLTATINAVYLEACLQLGRPPRG